jgi:hypothetical protein
MLQGLKQAVQDGQISETQVDASVTRILQLKMEYKIIQHVLALQLANILGDGEQHIQAMAS